MNLGAIRDEARFRLRDKAVPPFWPNEWLNRAINEAEQEACIRARLIEDKSSVITSLDIVTTEKRYELDTRIIDVLAIELESNPGVEISGWTLTENEFLFADYPKADDVILMTVIRLPMNDMENDSDEPEIRKHHHMRLLDWVEHRAYNVKDADAFSPGESEKALIRFEISFGKRQDANVQRKHREKTGRVVRMNPF